MDLSKLEWKRKFSCSGCGAMGRVTVYDIARNDDQQLYVECPFCDTRKYVESAQDKEMIERDLKLICDMRLI